MQWFGYMGMAFLLLRVDKTLQYWRSVYFAGHLLIGILFVIGTFGIPKPPRTGKHGPGANEEEAEIKRSKEDVRKAGTPIPVDELKPSVVIKQLKQAVEDD